MINTLISNISDKSIQNFIRSRNSSFREYKEDFSHILKDKTLFQNLYKLGEISYDNSDELLVFYCAYKGELSSKSSKRTQFEIAKKVLKEDFKDGAIFVFYDEKGKFRFSFIRKNYGNQTDKLSNWRRYTYFIDKEQQTNRTFVDTIGSCSFDSLDNIQERFNIEPISIEFFKGYKAQYEKFCNYMQTNKVMLKNFEPFLVDGSNKSVRDYVKKLLGRIVFLQFLQKKGWMGVPKESKDWIGGDPNFLENLYKSSPKEQQDNFLDEVLEPLFFNSLNSPRNNDVYDTGTSLGIVKIPYLNGGLFEKDKLDEPNSMFPSSYFKELFDFFNQYNFTIDENDPNDSEVSVDPEMLGHIFENLLEDNKDKGAFYTPKEIVHYMCQESLIEYLITVLNICSTKEKNQVANLIKYHDLGHYLVLRITEIDTHLDNVKICDPAIGSGAFPMGLLHEIFNAKQTLWLYRNQNLVNFPASEIKLNIIQNSIYGVDIEKGAVDIARLRFWLSLVVDENQPNSLPNLDFKIIQGNSLVECFEGYDLREIVKDRKSPHGQLTMGFDADKTAQALNQLIKNYFALKSSDEKHKVMLDINQQVKEHIKNCANHTPEILSKVDKIDFNNKPFFLWHLYFADVFEKGGFDIVIGNPPYRQLQADNGLLANLYENKNFKSFTRNGDLYQLFYEFGLNILKNNGHLCFITSKSWMKAKYGKVTRELLSKKNPKLFIDFNGVKIFESAQVYVNIIIVQNAINMKSTKSCVACNENISFKKFIDKYGDFKNYIEINSTNSFFESSDGWSVSSFEENTIIQKMKKKSTTIIELGLKCEMGIKSGLKKVFEIDSNEVSNFSLEERSIIKPIIHGKDISKYLIKKSNKSLLFIYRNFNVKNYPQITSYLKIHKDSLSSRATVPGHPWYELQQPQMGIYKDFEVERIVYPDIAEGPSFAISPAGVYQDNTTYTITSNSRWLLGILNSNAINFYYRKIANQLSGTAVRYFSNYVEQIPIPLMEDDSKKNIELYVNEILSIKQNHTLSETSELELKINQIVYDLFDLNESEIRIIEKLQLPL